MPSFSVTEPVAAPADVTWATVGNFADSTWMGIPMTVEGEGVGATRSIDVPGGAIVERCERLDDTAMVLGYESVSGSRFPATDYHGAFTVRATGVDTSEITWAATYETDDPEAMKTALSRAFSGGLKGMRDHIEGRSTTT